MGDYILPTFTNKGAEKCYSITEDWVQPTSSQDFMEILSKQILKGKLRILKNDIGFVLDYLV